MIEFYLEIGGIAPKRNKGDAGFDFYVPANYSRPSCLNPGEDILINTRVRSKFPKDIALIAFNKSGVATKKKLSVGACVVDSSYQGEIHIHLFNLGKDTIYIQPGDKLVQFVPIKIDCEESMNYVSTNFSLEEFYGEKSERGSGGFGSTGDKA